ncbi:MAG: phosphate/phosphite/phosphonate ABC transporter substrate-binding protein [Candidatus Cloacimonetes bacterium]|nr:phosphate/phosphite/phosphonate ABC transporter substrate-binding protein [Candidatus Cloacimonadota bacterium]
MRFIKVLLLFLVLLTVSCAEQAELGTKKNPIKMYFVPSMEAGKIVTSGREVADFITEKTGYHFKVAVPTSYASVIEAMGTQETDIAWLATFAYILASEKFGAEVALTVVRKGLDKYKGQFIAQTNSRIKTLKDIEGKIIAYTDAASASGYMYPSALLAKKGIKPAREFFAGGHPQAILTVYQGRADVGCTFWAPEDEEGPRDARRAVIDTYPDVMEKISIIGYTEWIPNDTVTFRKDFPPEMKEKIIDALLEFANSKEGHETLIRLLDIDNFVRASDEDYDVVRETLKIIDKDASELIE